ncbi:plasmid maintenance protein (plasmid) [Borrelia miyamotoi]|uniref:Plasmid maintenance protein n=4 Tax=Borrelia miyamotoi TaxID=47466 RepID=A0AAQ3CN70_9SPIR|nr:plasmid maintenance protein [Borrelia miyamotoi]AHH05549.1 Putative cytosolic protein [Borrelia miyamotoi FR64b]ATQ15488.1 plasmid maintenance protein [Borrelia miyamotoi]ATQ16745.1 plasmid maintenance protein [Borrelia miyamotoi]ATQ17974.1 plasmid maintenance protein [Borrelia miyamotoi]ATQ19002.1 plasmid maintenance protein [Borrelia miyamotoi]
MISTGLEIQTYPQPLKKYHSRYYKILSILRYFQNNALKYNQTAILNALNTFLLKDGLKQITLRTLRKDLTFLCHKGIIKKILLRLGEENGTYIRYTVTKYSVKNLKRILKAKEKIVEHDANSIYKFTKETQQKYYLQNKGIKIFKRKNATKNVSQYITNNTYINNKEKKERKTKSEEINSTDYLIKNVSKWKTMRYLDKIEENENKKRYEDSMIKTKKWLGDFKTKKLLKRIYDDQNGV